MTAVRVLAGLLVGLAVAAPAAGARTVREVSIPVKVEGSVQVEFGASGAPGCGGTCENSGSLAWEPAGDAELDVRESASRGRRQLFGSLVFLGGLGENGPTTTAHVVRAGADGSTRVCSDARTADLLFLDFSSGSETQLEARLTRGEPDDSDLFRTRCGGPLESDLRPALPAVALQRAALFAGGATVDLASTRSFSASGYSGSVRSSLRLKLGKPLPQPPLPPLARAPLGSDRGLRTLTATYAIESLSGSLVTSFKGADERSVCDPLDACGATGSVRLEPRVSAGSATFVAYGSARRTSGRGLRRALGLLPGARPRGVTAEGIAEWSSDAGSVATGYSGNDGLACADTVPLTAGFMTFWVGQRRVFADFGRAPGPGLDPFRSRCPGPSLPDVAQDHPLAVGRVPRGAFRTRRVTIPLDLGRAFASEPYTGETKPALSLVLRRVAVRERVYRADPIELGL
jgi:hypothetical protein